MSRAHIVAINISSGGIPKISQSKIMVRTNGLEGDRHNHAKHNTPLQAICIQDLEKLEELSQSEYTLIPGQAGENLTVKNLHVNSFSLGTILEFAGGVVLEISKVRKPCYVMDAINIHLKEDAIGRHGMYAKVLKEGMLAVGEEIRIKNV